MISRTTDGYLFEEHSLKAVSGKGLAHRELVSMLYKAAGFRTKDISTEMHCAITTANKRQQNINYKLKAKNTAQAITEAFRKGIIIHYILIITASVGSATNDHSQMARHRIPRTQSRTQQRNKRDSLMADTDTLMLINQFNGAFA
tara:strand:+ start:754 stop:1188 length:435 start_codon:yes stop_codon:yes gene_type:complete